MYSALTAVTKTVHTFVTKTANTRTSKFTVNSCTRICCVHSTANFQYALYIAIWHSKLTVNEKSTLTRFKTNVCTVFIDRQKFSYRKVFYLWHMYWEILKLTVRRLYPEPVVNSSPWHEFFCSVVKTSAEATFLWQASVLFLQRAVVWLCLMSL